MPKIHHRANLSAKSFPYYTLQGNNQVLVGSQDAPYTRFGSPAERLRDVNLPEVLYMHNYLPTVEGYAPVCWQEADPPISDLILSSTVDLTTAVLACSGASADIRNLSGNSDCTGTASAMAGTLTQLTEGNVNGTQYVFQAGAPGVLASFDGVNVLTAETPTGLNLNTAQGICASNGYLIAWTTTAVAWSSLLDPLDFTPSLITGAGGGAVQEIKSDILYCFPTAFGFIIYTAKNAVSAIYTGNSRFPFRFQEIQGAGGINSYTGVAKDSLGSGHYVYTGRGFQYLNQTVAAPALPDVNSAMGMLAPTPYFRSSTKELLYGETSSTVENIAVFRNRYVLFSVFDRDPDVGSSIDYGFIMAYDLQLERWGRLRIQHSYISTRAEESGVDATLRVYKRDGQFNLLELNITTAFSDLPLTTLVHDNVIIFGDYQYVRSRRITLDAVKINSIVPAFDAVGVTQVVPTVYCSKSVDGVTFETPVAGYLEASGTQREYLFNEEAYNFRVVIEGPAMLSSLLLEMHSGADV